MKKEASVFLSYSREDSELAGEVERALKKLGLEVWRDVRSIAPGIEWSPAIAKAIRQARGVAVLVTAASAKSEWVAYEYAFATGAGIPIVQIAARGATIPKPMQSRQVITYAGPTSAAKAIDKGISYQLRSVGQARALTPKLVAKFQEVNGKLCRLRDDPNDKLPSLEMDLWIENAPNRTKNVAFEILDLGIRDRKWRLKRSKSHQEIREFLTDDMNLYGDVEIWARGVESGNGTWLAKSRLYEALMRYYGGRPKSSEIRRGLRQIREN